MSVIKAGWATVSYYWTRFAAWVFWSALLVVLLALIGALVILVTKGAAGPAILTVLKWVLYLWGAYLILVILAAIAVAGLFFADLLLNAFFNLFKPGVSVWSKLKEEFREYGGHLVGGLNVGLEEWTKEAHKLWNGVKAKVKKVKDWIWGWFD